MVDVPRFHLAFPVDDLATARDFYGRIIGCAEGRSSDHWIDFDFFGHQIVAHLTHDGQAGEATSEVDGTRVPLRHFGVILEMDAWRGLTDRLVAEGVSFCIEPQIRFEGLPGEQATCFFLDPCGNAIECKAFADDAMVFAKNKAA